jgi:hypothetical protein
LPAKGATEIFSFAVDQTGNIYLLRPPSGPGNLVFRFSGTGEFISSFGLMGQGPNEMEYPSQILAASRRDNLYCVQQKKSGYKELVVYRMIWK